MQNVLKIILGLLLFTLLSVAWADDYVCRVTYNPSTPTVGNYGYITMYKHTEPDCGGEYSGSHIFCSKGATYGPCAAGSYQYSERGLLALYDSLLGALESNTRIQVQGVGCVNGGYGCGAYVNFYGD